MTTLRHLEAAVQPGERCLAQIAWACTRSTDGTRVSSSDRGQCASSAVLVRTSATLQEGRAGAADTTVAPDAGRDRRDDEQQRDEARSRGAVVGRLAGEPRRPRAVMASSCQRRSNLSSPPNVPGPAMGPARPLRGRCRLGRGRRFGRSASRPVSASASPWAWPSASRSVSASALRSASRSASEPRHSCRRRCLSPCPWTPSGRTCRPGSEPSVGNILAASFLISLRFGIWIEPRWSIARARRADA